MVLTSRQRNLRLTILSHRSRLDLYPNEERWQTIGVIDQTVVIVVHTLPAYDAETGVDIGRIRERT